MSAFLDRYHDMHHRGTTVDLINCPCCQDEFMEWARDRESTPVECVPVDRLEDRWV
jgi:hypothetical protein